MGYGTIACGICEIGLSSHCYDVLCFVVVVAVVRVSIELTHLPLDKIGCHFADNIFKYI